MSNFYDITNLTNAGDYTDIMAFNNEVTSGAFGLLLITIIFIVFFLATKNWPTEKAFAFSSFVTFMCATYLLSMGLIHVVVALVAVGLFLISIFTLMFKR